MKNHLSYSWIPSGPTQIYASSFCCHRPAQLPICLVLLLVLGLPAFAAAAALQINREAATHADCKDRIGTPVSQESYIDFASPPRCPSSTCYLSFSSMHTSLATQWTFSVDILLF